MHHRDNLKTPRIETLSYLIGGFSTWHSVCNPKSIPGNSLGAFFGVTHMPSSKDLALLALQHLCLFIVYGIGFLMMLYCFLG